MSIYLIFIQITKIAVFVAKMGNHEIVTEKQKKNYFLPQQDLNRGPLEAKASIDVCNRIPFSRKFLKIKIKHFILVSLPFQNLPVEQEPKGPIGSKHGTPSHHPPCVFLQMNQYF